MSNPIGNIGKSPVQSANKDIPVLEKQVAPQTTSAVSSFTSAFSSAAFTPTALGELGSTIAMTYGIALAKRTGEKLGKNPQGDLLPAITPVDQAFVDSYSSQAQSTLGLQANSLISQSQEQMAKAYKLTPGLIQDYTKNVTEGVNGILEQAPSTIRSTMQNQYAQQLQTDAHKMNMSMISQNKEISQSQAQVYATHQLQQMHDAQLNGNSDLAKNIYESMVKTNSANLASGIMSPAQADTSNTTAKLNYYSSREIQKAMDARHRNKLEGFLSDMIDNKPSEVTWGEWEKIRNQTVAYVGAVENLDNRDQSLILSQATAMAAIKPLTPDYIEKMKTQLSPTRFNTFMAKYVGKQKTGYAKQQQVSVAQANWSNTQVTGTLDSKVLNEAFTGMVEAAKVNAKQKGIELSDDDAQLETASTAGSPIPLYTQKLNKGLQSGNPQLMLRDWQDYIALKNQGGQLTQGVSKESISMGTMFNHFLEEGKTPEDAAAMAQQSVMNQTEEIQKQRAQIFTDWRKNSAKDSTHRESWARNLAGISKSTPIANGQGFALHMQAIMEDNIKYTGNVQAAEQMTKETLDQYWGYTNVNGQQEYTYMPVEKAINLDAGATSLIRQNLIDQVQVNFDEGKKAYDKGFMPYYIRLKSRPSYDEYVAAKAEVKAKQALPEVAKFLFAKGHDESLESITKENEPIYKLGMDKQLKIISEFESNKPVEVEMVHKGGDIQSYKLAINPSPLMQQSTGETVIIGDYDVTMSDDRGINYAMPGPHAGAVTHTTFRPNKTWIQNNYFAVNGIDPSDRQAKERVLSQRKMQQEMLSNPASSLLYRGIF